MGKAVQLCIKDTVMAVVVVAVAVLIVIIITTKMI